MRIHGTTLAEIDQICDYIPIVSTVSNLIDLFQKCIAKSLLSEVTKRNRYWTHIVDKSLFRCFTLLIPILGNIYILVSDYSKYKKDLASFVADVEMKIEKQRDEAPTIARKATQSSGKQVSADQMQPATIKEQHLWGACIDGNLETVRQLLDKGVSPNFYHQGEKPLITACAKNKNEIVDLLIKHKAAVNAPDHYGRTAFATACANGNLGIVQKLYPFIDDINQSVNAGMTPIMLAAYHGHLPTVQFLIEKHADPSQTSKDGNDAVSFAIIKDRLDVLTFLDPKNVDDAKYSFQDFRIFDPFFENLTPLMYAAIHGSVNSARYLLQKTDVQHCDSLNCTVLHHSVKHIELLRAILEKCKTSEFVNQQNNSGATALHEAVAQKKSEAALLLLKSGADPFVADGSGKSPLNFACENGLVDVLNYIKQNYQIETDVKTKIDLAIEAAKTIQEAPAQNNPLNSAIAGLESIGKTLDSWIEEEKKLGPIPRTGMEIIFGKIGDI